VLFYQANASSVSVLKHDKVSLRFPIFFRYSAYDYVFYGISRYNITGVRAFMILSEDHKKHHQTLSRYWRRLCISHIAVIIFIFGAHIIFSRFLESKNIVGESEHFFFSFSSRGHHRAT